MQCCIDNILFAVQHHPQQHWRALQVVYDPKEASFRQLLEAYTQQTDLTTKNRQGGDRGTQYRSGVYYHNEEQKAEAESFFKEVNAQLAEGKPPMGRKNKMEGKEVVAELEPVGDYYYAEGYHQQYLSKVRVWRYFPGLRWGWSGHDALGSSTLLCACAVAVTCAHGVQCPCLSLTVNVTLLSLHVKSRVQRYSLVETHGCLLPPRNALSPGMVQTCFCAHVGRALWQWTVSRKGLHGPHPLLWLSLEQAVAVVLACWRALSVQM